jgi:hypothetical protein
VASIQELLHLPYRHIQTIVIMTHSIMQVHLRHRQYARHLPRLHIDNLHYHRLLRLSFLLHLLSLRARKEKTTSPSPREKKTYIPNRHLGDLQIMHGSQWIVLLHHYHLRHLLRMIELLHHYLPRHLQYMHISTHLKLLLEKLLFGPHLTKKDRSARRRVPRRIRSAGHLCLASDQNSAISSHVIST